MKSAWNWMPDLPEGMWRHVPAWLRPFYDAVPWITVGTLLLMMYMIGGTMTKAEGVVFNLPAGGLGDGEATSLVALVIPLQGDICVFFDDARYSLDDDASTASLGEHLADRAAKVDVKSLLVLSDRRVPCEAVMKMASIARTGGLERILVANKSESSVE